MAESHGQVPIREVAQALSFAAFTETSSADSTGLCNYIGQIFSCIQIEPIKKRQSLELAIDARVAIVVDRSP